MGGCASSRVAVDGVDEGQKVVDEAMTASCPNPQPEIIGTVSMSTIGGAKRDVPVTVDDIAMPGAKAVLETPMFLEWVEGCEKDPRLFISRVHLQSVDMFGPRVGFVKLRSESQVTTGTTDAAEIGVMDVPGVVFLRGGSVAVLVILDCQGEEYTILVYQARVPAGDHNLPELPAGMLDGCGNFRGVAADEMQEECDIVISEDELVDLTEMAYGTKWRGMIPSAGGCDEFIRLYLLRRAVTRDVLDELEGRLTGVREEGELIKLHVLPIDSVWRATPDGKCLSALTLYRQLKMEGCLDEPDEEEDEAAASASDGGQDSDDSELHFDFGSMVHNADEMLIDRNEASPHTAATRDQRVSSIRDRLGSDRQGRPVKTLSMDSENNDTAAATSSTTVLGLDGSAVESHSLLAELEARIQDNRKEHDSLQKQLEAVRKAAKANVMVKVASKDYEDNTVGRTKNVRGLSLLAL